MANFEISTYFRRIKSDNDNQIDKNSTSRKIFLSYPTYFFYEKSDFELEYNIKNKICEFFNIPFYSIHFCGSAKTGKSLFKHTDFDSRNSDLDVSIISPELFIKYFEISFDRTNGFSDLTNFKRVKGKISDSEFRQYLSIGYFRPDLMPNCTEKTLWKNFFDNLSSEYSNLFKNINAGIFLSQKFFEFKQISALEKSLMLSFEDNTND